MSKENISFKDDLAIDPDALDVEWLGQSELYGKYAELDAQAKQNLREAEENLKVIRSELMMEARQSGEATTDKQCEAYYRTHPDHKEAKEDLIEAEYESNMMTAAVFAFNQRKVALENLSRLVIANYFSAPEAPRNLSNEAKRFQDSDRKRISGRKTGRRTGRSGG